MAGGLDFAALLRAVEGRDAETLVDLYAELSIVNRNTTPSSPHVLRGMQEISEYLRDVCSREMTHHVENEVVGENRISFMEACEYPDACPGRRDARVARRQDRTPGERRSLGRVTAPGSRLPGRGP